MFQSNLLSRAACAVALIFALSCGRAPEPEATRPDRAISPLAITGLFATGVNAAGTAALNNGNTDSHYVLSSNDTNNPGPHAVAIVPIPRNSGWLADNGTSTWIGATTAAAGGNGNVFTYTTTFSLPGTMTP